MTQPPDMSRGRTSVRVGLLGFVMLAGAVVSFAAGAPTAVGAAFLVLMVGCGLAALVMMIRLQSQARAWAADVKRQQQAEPWNDPPSH
ncbi:MAG TPA: hypothetical protein VE733_27800 [Streptosporangiaceae bacterium]|nr:hypothetical protein [Streptosporangiaceae bacterium]